MRSLMLGVTCAGFLFVIPGLTAAAQGSPGGHAESQSTASREIQLLKLEVADKWSPGVDRVCELNPWVGEPPADYQVVRIRLKVIYHARPFAAPSRLVLTDVLDRCYTSDCAARNRRPALMRRGEREALDAMPLPVTLEYNYSIPVRPNTPIKQLVVDGVVFDQPASSALPN